MKAMKPIPGQLLTDDEIHILADNQAAPAELAKLRDRLGADPVSQTRLMQWQHQRDALRRLHADLLHEAVSPGLLQAVQKARAGRDTDHRWVHFGGLAAGVVIAFGAGWLANASWQAVDAHQTSSPRIAMAQLENEFVRQASLAHNVYTPEVRHPVEVTAQEQAHLVQWLSKRLDKPLKIPDLTTLGFELVGGRLLPGDAGARAQFMFQNNAGKRVTLYLGAVEGASAPGLSSKETGFHYELQAGVSSFYWVDQGLGYALAGQLPREALMKLADAVYLQL
jgi:anti-sigma factor RsiW